MAPKVLCWSTLQSLRSPSLAHGGGHLCTGTSKLVPSQSPHWGQWFLPRASICSLVTLHQDCRCMVPAPHDATTGFGPSFALLRAGTARRSPVTGTR